MCSTSAFERAFITRERQSWSLYPISGSSRHDRLSLSGPFFDVHLRAQKRPDVRRATHGHGEVVTTDYAVVDPKVRMIPSLLDVLRASAGQRPIAAPRIFTISSLRRLAQVFWLGSGAEGIRTPDLRRAKAALSQLSYGPLRGVGQPGIEPGTSVLSGLRSSRLSYWPAADAWSLPDARPRRRLDQRRVEQRWPWGVACRRQGRGGKT